MTAADAVAEPASSRLARLLKGEPLLDRWTGVGLLSRGEAELVWLLVDAADRGRPMRVTTPGPGAHLATMAAVALAVRRLTHPGTRQPPGPTALVGAGPRHRALLAQLAVGTVELLRALRVVRLRRDGLVQPVPGAAPRPLSPADHLVLVSTRVGTPADVSFGPVVVDEAEAGNAYAELHEWGLDRAGILHVVAQMTPGAGVGGFVVDWPLVASEPARWPSHYRDAWGSHPETTILNATPEPTGLASARSRLRDALQTNLGVWPQPLRDAASLLRQLGGLAVPVDLYDAHTVSTIACPIAEKLEVVERTRASEFPPEWRSFAETSWALLKHDLLEAAADVESDNPKSEAVGLLVEQHLTAGEPLELWVDNFVHARALTSHLLSGGFVINSAQLDDGMLAIRTLGEPVGERRPKTSVVTGLPGAWHVPRLVAADLGRPMVAILYSSEEQRFATLVRWVVNAERVDHAQHRSAAYRSMLGNVSVDDVPPAITPNIITTASPDTQSSGPREWGVDAAEFAALADDDWLATLPGEAASDAARAPSSPVAVRALLVEPGPRVLLLRPAQIVDRLVAGRIRPTPASMLEVGMSIMGVASNGMSLFERLRPYLDRLHGLGTRFWLDRWDDALRSAVARAGGRDGLARDLVARGATITAPSVAGWASPYRIGPRDPRNVLRVAEIAEDSFVGQHAHRIASVMRGVRIEHHRLGRALTRALRRHGGGHADAFDQIEDRLAMDIGCLFEDLEVYTVQGDLGTGTTMISATGRLLAPRDAREIFSPGVEQT